MKKTSVRKKLNMLVLISIIPVLALTVYLLYSLLSYSNAYDEIVSNMTIANSYNLNFKEEMDESIYKLVVTGTTFDKNTHEEDIQNPYELIDGLRNDFTDLEKITTDRSSRRWLQTVLRNLDTLEDRVDDIGKNIEEGGQYQKSIDMLDNNIYILTELIQDDIQYYIYYQTQSIEYIKTELNHQVFMFLIIIAIVLAALIGLVSLITHKLVKDITVPIGELSDVAKKISSGDLTARADIGTGDEIEVLGDNVNQMAGNLQIMMTQIRDDERKMRHAELRLLQEQINPHFLYNTLDTIVWLIEGGKSEEAENMVVSLSHFFRLVLSKGKEFISIRDEESHIRSYLEIQKMRYREILNYEIDIDPEIYDFSILKLTLQPIVENALYHGIKEKRDKGLIKITGTRDGDNIRLVVEDNGAGMTQEELESLREEISRPCSETKKGFGLANVNERIRMYFGSGYGMTIESEKDKGARVTVVIPARRAEIAGEESEISGSKEISGEDSETSGSKEIAGEDSETSGSKEIAREEIGTSSGSTEASK